MVVNPAPQNTGILFRRADLGDEVYIHALSRNVSSTARSTSLSEGGATIHTVEHLLSALTGMGIDNAIVDVDNIEVPILDGSAFYYVKAFGEAGTVSQEAERKYLKVSSTIRVEDQKSGSWVSISPSEDFSYDVTSDFSSKVLGVQRCQYTPDMDYATQIAPCRTFVFFHEIEFLFANNLIKGGDVDNAIVIVEHPVTDEQVARVASAIGKPALKVTSEGYLSNLKLHFPDETGRHKLLDLVGDIRLCGGFIKGRVEAYKPGHSLNTELSKAIEEALDPS